MKKLVVLFALLATAFFAHAQTPMVGLKGGLNVSSIDYSGPASFSNRLGFNGGLFVNIPVGSNIVVQPEVVYSSQGARYSLDGAAEHNLALNYINIPVMLQANIGRGVYAEAGPQIGFLTSAKDQVNNVETGFFTSQDFKKTDVAIGLGLGYRGNGGFGVNARYNLGLTDINNYGSNTLRNNALQVGLTIGLSR